MRTISGELLTAVLVVKPIDADFVLRAASLINVPSFHEVHFAPKGGQRPTVVVADLTLPNALQAPSEGTPPSDDFWTKFGSGSHRGQ